ncbi:AraC family transcriptional regulator [Bermanella marisrubri]|uniref:Transcriptional Regulator, AraC family protein n=1 Tax=Bermanella marisrubri TaxID=207949 RepID=Q1N5E2_9GAMM|nr:AraC family transcriptional regulator [Bermanella marisrubri]EAT13109.1 Transcriptional Regulator, AraC family protein [Oceanobacter sp. RED65] [Bermanella marisrubri]QIZ83887.1 AraC family transcriptional regulator [Bermanella marisrubri]
MSQLDQPTHKRVSIHWIKAILAAAESLGINANAIQEKVNITLDLDRNEPAYLSLDQTQDIWEAAETLSGHEFFGLRMGQNVRPSYFHAVAYVAMTSANLFEAFKSFQRYMPLISEGAILSMSHEQNRIWVEYTPVPDYKAFSRHQHESVMALLLAFSRWLLGDESVTPIEVKFATDTGPGSWEYQQVFGVTPRFSQNITAMEFEKAVLQRPLKESDAGLHTLHRAHADQLLAAHSNTSWKAKVIKTLVESGHYHMTREQVANKLNVSTRTLQRRLQQENTNFIDVMDEQRRVKAEELIIKTDRSLKQIAEDLGFAESSTFYRACHRWFDCTPNELRQSHTS